MQQFIIDGVVEQVAEELEERAESVAPEYVLEDIYSDEITEDGMAFRIVNILAHPLNREDSYEDILLFCPMGNYIEVRLQRVTGNARTTLRVFNWHLTTEISDIVDWVIKYYEVLANAAKQSLFKAYEAKEFVPVRWLQANNLLIPGTLCVVSDKPDESILIGHATPLLPPNFRQPYSYDDPNKWDYHAQVKVLAQLLPKEEQTDAESD